MKPTREMICIAADGTEIERRPVAHTARISAQAIADHRAADFAKVKLGERLDHVRFIDSKAGFQEIVLHFDAKGRSFLKSINA